MERGWKTNVEVSPNCPRCGSSNTKFCYYNNYSLTQPRYFCKGCRRYWTKGGSLRNVPVGGGCRKNRRASKSLRLSNDGVQSRSLAYGNLKSDPMAMGHSFKGNSMVESTTSSSMMPDGSHIDLALVYANFLNQKPDCKKDLELPELPAGDHHFNSTSEFSIVSNTNLNSSTQLENGFFGCHASVSELPLENCVNTQMYLSSEQSIRHDTSNYGLPPLPGEAIASQEVLWPSSHQMMVNHAFQETQLLGPEALDPNSLISNWSPFDLSRDDTF